MQKRRTDHFCVAELGAVTVAMHAQALLREASIKAQVVKTDGKKSGGGCSYAVTFPCCEQYRMNQVLTLAGIPIRRVFAGGSDGK